MAEPKALHRRLRAFALKIRTKSDIQNNRPVFSGEAWLERRKVRMARVGRARVPNLGFKRLMYQGKDVIGIYLKRWIQ